MNKTFLETILSKHQFSNGYPSTNEVCSWVVKLMLLMFPEKSEKHYNSVNDIEKVIKEYQSSLAELLKVMEDKLSDSPEKIAAAFFSQLPELFSKLGKDAEAIMKGDPAARSEFEVICTYPGFYTIVFYRIANALHKLQVPLIPRIISEHAHSKTGIDIHPGANIGDNFFIDHGTGIVVGETTIIGNNVKLYQGVTLGALSVSKDKQDSKRHPTIEDNVIIYAGATILGGETIVGHDSVIGGNVWLTESIPPFTKVFHKSQIDMRIS